MCLYYICTDLCPAFNLILLKPCLFFFQAAGTRLAIVVTSVATGVACTVYALYNGWKLSLVVLSFIPFLIIAGAIQMKVAFIGRGTSKDGEDDIVQSGKVRHDCFIWIQVLVVKSVHK